MSRASRFELLIKQAEDDVRLDSFVGINYLVFSVVVCSAFIEFSVIQIYSSFPIRVQKWNAYQEVT
jgi:hypothetical protein